jgi:hypothetical protein
MARELADRRDRLFGREGDLAALIKRARYKGLTAVVARPQMGKSWLLIELARRLGAEHQPPYLVGFAESFGETPDLLLRTVVDSQEGLAERETQPAAGRRKDGSKDLQRDESSHQASGSRGRRSDQRPTRRR